MADNKVLGKASCLLCGFDVEIKESKQGKPYYSCNECLSQYFARGEVSMSLMRKMAVPDVVPNPVIESQEKPEEKGWFG